mgnify:CR=1 FL=1
MFFLGFTNEKSASLKVYVSSIVIATHSQNYVPHYCFFFVFGLYNLHANAPDMNKYELCNAEQKNNLCVLYNNF